MYRIVQIIADTNEISQQDLNYDSEIYHYFSQNTKVPITDIIITNNEQILQRGSYFSQLFSMFQENIIFTIHNINSILSRLQAAQNKEEIQKAEINQLKELNEKQQSKIKDLEMSLQKHKESLNTTMECSQVQSMQQNNDQNEKNQVVSYYPFKDKNRKQLDTLIIQKDNELGVLKKIRDSFINYPNIDQSSEFFDMNSQCSYCNLIIQGETLQTPCQHNYHLDCFDTLVQSQVFQKCQTLTCICNTKLKFECMKNFLTDFRKYYAYKEQFLNNQIIKLKNNNSQNIKSCQNKGCFFFILNSKDQFQINNFFCPLCQQ